MNSAHFKKIKNLSAVMMMLFLAACSEKTAPVEIITYNQLDSMIQGGDEKIKIYNIWATWCAPCVKELPHFNEVAKNLDEVELVLVSLDKVNEKSHVQRFLNRGDYTGKHYILNEKGSKWLTQFDSTWTGAIPVTLVKYNNKRTFFEGPISQQTLENTIKNIK